MSGTALPYSKIQFFDSKGKPLAGGWVYSYLATTSTPTSTYTDSTFGTPNANPVRLDAGGYAAIFLGPISYKFALYNGGTGALPPIDGSLVWTQDNIADAGQLIQAGLIAPNGGNLVTFTASGSGAVNRSVQGVLNDTLSVKHYGARGDGTTDDTAAIQLAINQGIAVKQPVEFPVGTYIISPSSFTMLSLATGSVLLGRGGILKVKPSAGPYNSIFRAQNASTNITIDGLIIDANIDNNPIVNLAEIAAHTRTEFYLVSTTNCSVTNCTVMNSSSANSVVFAQTTLGGSPAAEAINGSVSNCKFLNMGDDPNHIKHDMSTIFAMGNGVSITGNQITAASINAPAVVTGIETHGSQVTVTGNTVLNYQVGTIVTGSNPNNLDDESICITGNSFNVSQIGVSLWSLQSAAHTTGFGMNGLTVTGNSIRIHQMEPAILPVIVGGITVKSESNMPSKNWVIVGNSIAFDLEVTLRPALGGIGNYASWGIGGFITVQEAFEIDNLIISDNVVENAPVAAIGFVGAVMKNVQISNNVIINPGASQDASISSTSKVPFEVFAHHGFQNVSISYNHVYDTRATCPLPYMIVTIADVSSTGDLQYIQNEISIADAVHAAWVAHFYLSEDNSIPLIRMNTTTGLPWTLPGGFCRSGSKVWDVTTGREWNLIADGKSTSWLASTTGYPVFTGVLINSVAGSFSSALSNSSTAVNASAQWGVANNAGQAGSYGIFGSNVAASGYVRPGSTFITNNGASAGVDIAALGATSSVRITTRNNSTPDIICSNHLVTIVALQDFANNAAALAGGLTAGMLYHITGADTLGVVH